MSGGRFLLGTALVALALAGPSGARAEGVPSSGDGSVGAPPPGAGEAQFADEDLDRVLIALRDAPPDGERAAAMAVATLDRGAVDSVARRLAALRRDNDEGAASLVRTERERGSKEGPDLLQWLLSQPPGRPRARALEMDCLYRALAHAGTTPAVRQLVAAASDLAGAFRSEIGHLVRGLGERAIPALIESRRDPAPEVRSWGAALLAPIAKHPSDALHVKDDALLGEVMRAYGKVSDMEALPEILPLATSDRIQVRIAAREAVLAYGQDAVWRLREAYAVLLGEPAPDGMPATELAKKLFEADDRYRLRDLHDRVDQGVALDKAGKYADAVTVFDDVLSREPLLDRGPEMVDAYVKLATSREATDRSSARQILRKALRLDESGPSAAHLRSELHRLDGEILVAEGVDDTSPFEEALAVEPGNQAARADLERLRPPTEPNKTLGWRLVAAIALVATAAAGIASLGGRRPRGPRRG